MSRFSSDPQEMDRGLLKKRCVQRGFKETSKLASRTCTICTRSSIWWELLYFFLFFGDFSRFRMFFKVRETTVNIEIFLELCQCSYPFLSACQVGNSGVFRPEMSLLAWSFLEFRVATNVRKLTGSKRIYFWQVVQKQYSCKPCVLPSMYTVYTWYIFTFHYNVIWYLILIQDNCM